MYLQKIIRVLSLGIIINCGISVFADSTLSDLQKGVSNFSDNLAKSLPFNASLGLNWSDAYIGQFLGIPPHFGIGVSGGFTTMDSDSVKNLLNIFDLNLPIDFMILPAYAVDARIGGFFLPFDVGVKFGILPNLDFGDTLTIDYLLIGGDIRYAVLKGKVLPMVSVGFGVNYLRGGLGATFKGAGQRFTFDGHSLALSDPTVGFTWETTALDVKAQVSKSFRIITPALGVGLSYAWSKAGYTVDSKLTYDGQSLSEKAKGDIQDYLTRKGLTGIDFDSNGFSSLIKKNGVGLRAFGGLSFNLALIRLDLTGMFNFFDANWGATLGIRFQL